MKKLISIFMIVATISLAAFGRVVYLTVPPATFNFNTVNNLKTVKMQTRKCPRCGEEKPFDEFHKLNTTKNKIQVYCKKCQIHRTIDYKRTKEGLTTHMYIRQKLTSKRRGRNAPEYTRVELTNWCLSQSKFHELYDNWKASGFDKMKIPSCDRTDDYKAYSLDRLQLMTWEENRTKGYADRKNGINNKLSKAVVGTHKKTGTVVEFYSMCEAARKLKMNSTGGISSCCLGKSKSAGGYFWEYK